MDNSKTSTNIILLNSGNYQDWKFKVELLLMKEGVYDVVFEPIPEDKNAAWIKMDRKAKATIGLSVEDNQTINIRNLPHAADYWKALKELHEKPNLVNKVSLYKRMWKCHLEGKTMEDHINGILCLVNELRALGEDIKDAMVVALMLGSLTEEYDSLISALEIKDEADLTVNYVKEKLIQAYKRQNKSFDEDEQAHKSSISKKKNFKRGNGKAKVKCFDCGKLGHVRADCSVKQKEAKKATHSCLVASKKDKDLDSWFIDSGATSHMCNNKKAFKTLNRKPSERIKVADGRFIETKAVGSVHLPNMELEKVSFVPDLESNLVSVAALTENGFKLVFQGNSCQISKKNEEVLNIKKENRLYEVKTMDRAKFSSKEEKVQTDGITDLVIVVKLTSRKLLGGMLFWELR